MNREEPVEEVSIGPIIESIDSKEQLFDNDWAHIQIETRAGNASINQGDIPKKVEYFEVDGIGVNFSVKEIN